MNLSDFYKRATLYPSIVVLLSTIVFAIIDNHDYESEWMTAGSVIFLAITTAITYCIIMSLLSLTIFLNKKEQVKQSSVLRFLSWFLLPFGFIAIVFVYEISFTIKYEAKFGNTFIYLIVLNIPFIAALIWSYVKFKKLHHY